MRAFLLLFLLPNLALAAVVPSDKAYQTLEKSGYQYVYSEDHVAEMPKLIQWNEWFKAEYQKSYQWTFDQEAALVITSGQNQIANGFATVVPHLKTVFYPSGALMRDEFAIKSWMKVLMIHESAHLYQLNVKDTLPGYIQKIVGNSIVIPTPIVVPVFIHPNIFVPTFILEGNAMMNESRWGIGGRLYSGEIRAVTYSQVLNNEINATRLINDHLEFPFGAEKYYQGGHFQQFLAEKYGIAQTNLFFKNQSEHFVNPFILNDTFIKTFGSGYNQLITEYNASIKEKALGQRTLPETALDSGWFFSSLNHDKDEVFFLVPQKGKSYPWLWQIKKTAGAEIQKKEIDLASGKVFKTDRGWATASAKQESPSLIEYGLYLEKLYAHPDYRGQMVTDLRAGHSLYLDPVKSFDEGQLYLDKKYFGVADSDALLDDAGRVYYFKQQGTKRSLYRDQEELFSYEDYYGKLMEIDEEGGVYFVASTAKGSGLFYWSAAEGIREALASDQIVEARRLADGKFLAVEVDHRGYHYKIAGSVLQPATPHQFVNPNEAALTERVPEKTAEELKAANDLAEARNYYALRELRYDNLDFYYGTGDDDSFTGALSANFSDPLAWNALNISYARNSYQRDSASVTYFNQRHQLQYQLGYFYDEDALVARERLTRTLEDNAAYISLLYPLFIHGRWSADWAGQAIWEKEERVRREADDTFNFTNSLMFNWGIHYPLGFQTFRGFRTVLKHQLEVDREPFRHRDDIFSGNVYFDYDLGKETYFTAAYESSFSNDYNVTIDNSFIPNSITDDYYSLSVDREYPLNRLQIKEIGLKKAINQSKYFARWPLSIRRWAPFVNVRHYDIKEDPNNPDDNLPSAFWEYELGAEIEFLLVHRLPMRSAWSIHAADPEPFQSDHNSGWNLRIGTFKDF